MLSIPPGESVFVMADLLTGVFVVPKRFTKRAVSVY